MRAIVIDKDCNLELRDVVRPQPGPGQVRVRVRACGVNRADLLQRRGLYPAPPDAPKDIPGLEVAGEVELVGEGTSQLKVGDRVFGIVSGGAYAEAVVVHERTLALIPAVSGSPLGFTSAAAIPEAFITAYDAMVPQGALSAGETVLVHAVGSGVGTAALQIANAIGATVIGTGRSKEKLDRAAALAPMEAIVVEGSASGAAPRFAERVRERRPAGVDLVLDLVGGAYVPESLAALSDRGRLVLVGLMAGARAEIDLGMVLRRRLQLFGTVLRSRPLEEKILATRLLTQRLCPLFARGRLAPIVDRVFPLERASEALDYMASNASFGKVVLEVA
jgi:putative PIG3 family NAD(P)H quinone oxidoreductase